MKLKKIVSLAMAGVLAVSMLAGCSTNGTPEQPEQPETPATGISAEIGTMVNHPAYVTFADSDKLDANLKASVQYAGVMDVMPQYVNADKLQSVAGDVAAQLDNRVGVTFLRNGITPVTLWNIGSAYVLLDAEKANSYEIDDAVAVEMYAVSSAIGEDAIKDQIADIIKTIPEYQYSVNSTDGSGSTEDGGNYNHTYTVSVSTCTKAVNSTGVGGVVGGIHSGWTGTHGSIVGGGVSAANPSVTFVAVQVVRTATHQ